MPIYENYAATSFTLCPCNKLELIAIILQEFSKEVDAKSSLRSSVLSTGNQLLRLKRVETAGLRTALGHIDTQWAELLTRIPVVQEKLHQVCWYTSQINSNSYRVFSLLFFSLSSFFLVANGEISITARHHGADELDHSHGEHYGRGPE